MTVNSIYPNFFYYKWENNGKEGGAGRNLPLFRLTSLFLYPIPLARLLFIDFEIHKISSPLYGKG